MHFCSFATRRVTSIATLGRELMEKVPALALSPDGRRLLSVHVEHEVNDLMLVEKFG